MPARADLLTGRLSLTFMTWAPLPADIPTLPALLGARAGYLTMGIVDTPFYVRNGFGYDRGFQDFLWLRGQGDARRMEERLDARPTWRHESDRWVARTVTAAEEWLERHHREQLLPARRRLGPARALESARVLHALYAPDYDGRETETCYDDWRAAGLTEDDVRLSHATYAGEVTMVDRWLGRLVEKLDLLGIADDTVLVFVSDHGYYFGEHGLPRQVGLGRRARHAELVAALPRDRPGPAARSRCPAPCRVARSALTTLVDVPATILDLAGVDRRQRARGSLVRARPPRGETDEHRRARGQRLAARVPEGANHHRGRLVAPAHCA